MVFKDQHPVNDQFQIVAVELFFCQNIGKHLQCCLGRTIDLDDGVALVGQQINLMVQAIDLLLQFFLQLVVGGFDLSFLLLAALGIANMWEAVFADVGVTVIAVLNALRAMRG